MSALMDIETSLIELKGISILVGHLEASGQDISPAALSVIRERLGFLHDTLAAEWKTAFAERNAAREAWDAERQELKAAPAAPGSIADVERAETLWKLLEAANATVRHVCDQRNAAAGDSA